jgi:hypothetical protein
MRTEWNRVRSSQSAFNTLKGNLERKAPDDSIQDRDGDGSKSRPSMILDLPTEILTKILELVLSTQNFNQVPWRLYQLSWDPTAIPALAYTCRRFSQIAVPFNFRNICIDDFRQTVIPWTERPKRLLQVLRSNPSLGSHCRDFSMRIESNPDLRERRSEGDDLEFTSQLLLSFPNVRSLSVNGGWGADESAWKLLRLCLPRLCHLERLELRTDGFEGLKVTEVIQRLQDQVPNLKGLEVHGFKQDPVPPLEGHEVRGHCMQGFLPQTGLLVQYNIKNDLVFFSDIVYLDPRGCQSDIDQTGGILRWPRSP